MIPIFLASVEAGRLVIEDKDKFRLWVGKFTGKKVEVIVRKKKRPRSTGKPDELGNQNGWYRGVIVPMSAQCLGYTADEMHEVFISEFAPYNYRDFAGKKVAIKIRTSDMDTVQMAQFTEACRIKMAELGCFIPDPEKVEV